MNQLATVRSLQQRISEMQPLRLGEGGLPVAPELRPLLPSGVLQKGAPTSVRGSLQLSLSLLAAASAGGAWCGVIGVPNLGFECAEQLGLALERLVVVPEPGRHALSIAGMLGEVLTALVLLPSQRPAAGEVERLNARLRDHGTALIVMDEWPRSAASLRVAGSRWSGLGEGHGLLRVHELTVDSTDRRGRRSHTVRFCEGRLVSSAPRIGGGRP